VLCIPNFSINLLSISTLCHNSNCTLFFDASKCVIQDLSNQRMIGLAEAFEGLYHLNLHDKNVNVVAIDCPPTSTMSAQAIWHLRLGHLSTNRLSVLHSKFLTFLLIIKAFVMYVILLDTRKFPFHIVLIKLVLLMNCCMLIFGVPLLPNSFMVTLIFWL
jgi:hypothetical protein